MDLWDCFHPRWILDAQDAKRSLRLFRSVANIGNPMCTNMQVPGQISCDQMAVILNWYARTNLLEVYQPGLTDFTRAWKAWADSAIATLVIGHSPRHSQPLSSLLGPRTFGSLCGIRERGAEDDIGQIARANYTRWVRQQPGTAHLDGTAPTFSDLTPEIRAIWMASAEVCPLYRPVIVPVRQIFSVDIEADRKATEVLLRVMPKNVAPSPLVWVHLAGLMTRVVA